MKNRASYTLEIFKIVFFIFLSFWLSLHSSFFFYRFHFFNHFRYHFFHVFIIFFLCLSFFSFCYHLFFIVLLLFYQFFFMFHHFCFQWCKKFCKKMKNCNFPPVFFICLSWCYHVFSFFNHVSSFLLPVVQKCSKK